MCLLLLCLAAITASGNDRDRVIALRSGPGEPGPVSEVKTA
jgi:hypothetical protein